MIQHSGAPAALLAAKRTLLALQVDNRIVINSSASIVVNYVCRLHYDNPIKG